MSTLSGAGGASYMEFTANSTDRYVYTLAIYYSVIVSYIALHQLVHLCLITVAV
jgi:hypothetical protein